MNKSDKVKNIVAFLCIIFSEDSLDALFEKTPDYILEKFERFVESPRNDEWLRGLHPTLRRHAFDRWVDNNSEILEKLDIKESTK